MPRISPGFSLSASSCRNSVDLLTALTVPNKTNWKSKYKDYIKGNSPRKWLKFNLFNISAPEVFCVFLNCQQINFVLPFAAQVQYTGSIPILADFCNQISIKRNTTGHPCESKYNMLGEFRIFSSRKDLNFFESRNRKLYGATHKFFSYPYANQPSGSIEVHVHPIV